MDTAQSFQKLPSPIDPLFRSFDLFPFPVEVFANDGTALFVNRSALQLLGIPDSSLIVQKYNLLTDPVCNDLLGHREIIEKAFAGQTMVIPDFKPPIQDLVDRGIIREKPYESALMELYLSPVKDKDTLIFVVCVFIVKSIYRGRPEVVKAKEYISRFWRGKFNPHETAKFLGTSVTQLYRLFKQYDSMTPGEYHRQCKIAHIKEKLADQNLTIKEAFSVCGENNQSWMGRAFTESTGLSPTQW